MRRGEVTNAATAAAGSRQPYLTSRPREVHSLAPWDPFSYVAGRLESLVHELGRPSTLPSGARVLDYGCATQPYRGLFGPGIEYVGADIAGNPLAQVELSEEGDVPLPDSSFDMVLSTQVLEHVVEPARYLSECRRLLKPGGSLVLTTHGIMYYHPDPEDYWRWTSAGLAKVVKDAGLHVAEMRGVMGLASAALQLLQWATLGHVPRRARRPYTIVMQRLIAASDRRHSDESRLHNALVLGVCAVRPADEVQP
ncbi:MAG TPA: class I SAM-dependent methyltransferase [Acidimicrobiales bacterium]|nr:class I SAM-dependent methyltransferase [Acidimicrobiales bacterium]